jgi:3-oxoadipate enol-lactonase
MAWVERNGVRLYVEREGSGPPLLFISGSGGDLRVRPNGFDQPFAGSFDLVCYDQRGLGQSDRPPTPWSMVDYADDAAAVIEWAGWPQVAVAGVSFGGMVAQELLVRHPDRVSHAVLACTSSGGEGGSSYPLHQLASMPANERMAMQLALLDTRWADPDSADPLRATMAGAFAEAGVPHAGAVAQLEARRFHDTWSRLSAVHCPVLVCAGRYDGIAPLPNSEALARQIPGARLEVFEGGHAFMFQDPSAHVRMGKFLLHPDAG